MNVSFVTISEVFNLNPLPLNLSEIEASINCNQIFLIFLGLLPFGAGFGAFGSCLLLTVFRKKNAL
jgi:hypothetical protein